MAAWILRRPPRARVDAVTGGRGADSTVNTVMSRLGKLWVAGSRRADRLAVGPVRYAGTRRQRPVARHFCLLGGERVLDSRGSRDDSVPPVPPKKKPEAHSSVIPLGPQIRDQPIPSVRQAHGSIYPFHRCGAYRTHLHTASVSGRRWRRPPPHPRRSGHCLRPHLPSRLHSSPWSS
jgi:hypothetical protein